MRSDNLHWLKIIYNNLYDYFCAVLEMYFIIQEEAKKILLNLTLMETISSSLMKLRRLLLTTLKLSSVILTYMVPLLLGPLILPLPDLLNILTYDSAGLFSATD